MNTLENMLDSEIPQHQLSSRFLAQFSEIKNTATGPTDPAAVLGAACSTARHGDFW